MPFLTTPQEVPSVAREMRECPICYEELKVAINTQCNHAICIDCAYSWFTGSNKCAICRQEVYQMGAVSASDVRDLILQLRAHAMQLLENPVRQAPQQRRDFFEEAVHRILDAQAPNGQIWRVSALVKQLRDDDSAGRHEFGFDETLEMLREMQSEGAGLVVFSNLVVKPPPGCENAGPADRGGDAEEESDETGEEDNEDSEGNSGEDSGEHSGGGDEDFASELLRTGKTSE
ncbi:hypothetical protein CERZMDRAFT_97104 [Cercospora zeae-maydis SCOH1-5]|uniref:RING-type domain-containing protein n=1 Tax=Cercospora zeae-maydis SCOH1-5 TaxID=717836 RepID=A0A6A6FGP0_9PEZI|nr:hypothetical protein CERZMDRAFT_97104 [Cercospora zeae-maydis SCOH1-5]